MLNDQETHFTKTITLTLPIEDFALLDSVRSATGIPYSGIIQYFLGNSELGVLVESLLCRLDEGAPIPRIRKQARYTRKTHETSKALLDALRPLPSKAKKRRLTELDQALSDKLTSALSPDTYHGGNYV